MHNHSGFPLAVQLDGLFVVANQSEAELEGVTSFYIL